MTPLAVIKAFDVFLDCRLRIGAGGVPAVMYQLALKTAPEAFHWGVVIAIPLTRHGGLHAELFHQLAVVMSTVLAPAVRVMNQSVLRAFVAHGAPQGLLTKAVGEYSLDSISGSGGANGMWDTWKTRQKWRSNVSGISNGMRQAETVKLSPVDIRLLNSMRIKVDPDLTMRFLARGKTIVTIPYRDNGMQFDIKNASNRDVDELKKLSSSTTVLDEQLFLLAQDEVDYSAVISGHFDATVNDIVIVSYSTVADTFNVSFVLGQCCGNSIFTFTRRHRP
jgi:hypothetical protein